MIKEYQNEITDLLDSLLLDSYKDSYKLLGNLMTYIWVDSYSEKEKIYPIRSYSGGTKGHIKVDNRNVIKEIKIYNQIKLSTCFKPNANEEVQRFIGTKLKLERKIK